MNIYIYWSAVGDTQYFSFSHLVRKRINQKAFRRMSRPHKAAHVRSTDSPNLIHRLATIVLFLGDCENESHQELQTFQFEWHIYRLHLDTWHLYVFTFEFSNQNCCFDKIVYHFHQTESEIPLPRRGRFMLRKKWWAHQFSVEESAVAKKLIRFKFVIDILREWVILNVIKIINIWYLSDQYMIKWTVNDLIH